VLFYLALTITERRATHAEALLRKVDERKAAAEVERRRATEAAGRLEQQASCQCSGGHAVWLLGTLAGPLGDCGMGAAEPHACLFGVALAA